MTKNKIVKLDLACGQNKKSSDYIGVDIIDDKNVDLVHDLNVYPYPFEDNSVDEIYCSHYVEHIPHDNWRSILLECDTFEEFKKKALQPQIDGLIKFMNEIYRILKPDGKVKIIAPYVTHVRAFGDPTHTRYIHDWSFYYFNKEWRDINKLDKYPIFCDFDIRYSYLIDESLILKSDEVRKEIFHKNWNCITDLIIDLTKR